MLSGGDSSRAAYRLFDELSAELGAGGGCDGNGIREVDIGCIVLAQECFSGFVGKVCDWDWKSCPANRGRWLF
jgi:hypothetical protein